MITIDANSGRRLAEQLRLWRERALLTQEQLARSTGLGVRTIRRLETRVDRRPRSESIRLLAAALNLSDDELALLTSAGQPLPPPREGVPRQLPRGIAGFTGRDKELVALDGYRPGLVVISGTAGVGKTSLALHWAHRVAATFQDGTLYLNLRGFDPESPPVATPTALRAFLTALGVPPGRIPLEPEAQVALYRSTMAGRQILIVLDNAVSAQQVRPLLPATASAMVIVTSRNRLAGLAATDDARLITLDLLATRHARRLLGHRLGSRRVAAEPYAANEIVGLCAGLPLALAVAAARATAEPSLALGALAAQLRDTGQRLDALELADDATDVRAVFFWSYRRLDPAVARMFRLLGVHPGAEISVPAAASLAELDPAPAQTLLRELVVAHLIGEPSPHRYVMHDLLHLFAREQAGQAEARDADARLADHYLHSSLAANRALYPLRRSIAVDPPRPGTLVCEFESAAEARGWLLGEHRTLLGMLLRLSAAGEHRHAWQLAWSLATFLQRQGFWQESLQAQQLALRAAEQLGDPGMRARTGRTLARIYAAQPDQVTAQRLLLDALEQAERSGDRALLAGVHLEMSLVLQQQSGDRPEAGSHARTALDLYQRLGDVVGQADALNSIGSQLVLAADPEAALVHFGRALDLLGRVDVESSNYAETLHNIAVAHHRLGRGGDALSDCGRALELTRARGDLSLTAAILATQGDVYDDLGDAFRAGAAWQEALSLLEGFDHRGAERLRAKLAGARP
ncbi:MAG TPA: helix-turn-helix domain-containing protein [Candidatus Limnocylindrales bacterium]